jgi:DNA replication and repair protein RecF
MIERIRLTDFRNLKDVSLSFSPSVNIFLGDNGQGKSNILEAITILSSGDSFRFAKNENLIHFNKPFSRITAIAKRNDLDFDVSCEILKSKKNFFVNKKKASQTDLYEKFPIVLFSPESLSSIKEGADLRRQLIDELVISINPVNGRLISDFRKALKTRNRILKNYLDGTATKNETENILESLHPTYFQLCIAVTIARLRAIRGILSDFKTAIERISDSKNVDISVEYVISDHESLQSNNENIQFLLKKRFTELHNAELASGASLVGPHKHDIVFLFNGNDSRFYCSQGQQRALILSFKMAQIVYHKRVHGTYPILLLDDVLSELDSSKRSSLIRFLGELKTQIFITTTDFDLSNSLRSEDCAVLKIRDGTIEEPKVEEI